MTVTTRTDAAAAAPPAAWRIWSALGLVYVFWGSTYLAIAYVVDTMPAFLSAAARFAVAAVLLLGFLVVRRGRGALRMTRRQLGAALGIGALLLCGGNGLVTLAEQRELPSGLAALLIAAVPLWVVLLRAGAGDRPAARTVLGVGLGFCGVAVLLLPGARPEGVELTAAAMCVVASLLWSVGSFAATRVSLPPDALMTTVVQMVGGCLALVVAGTVRGETVEPSSFSTASVLAWAFLVVFGSLVAFTAYSWLLGVAPVSKVATYAYVNPVVAVVLGAVVAGEVVGGATVVGGAVTVLAVAVVVSEEGRRRRRNVPVQAPVEGPAAPAADDLEPGQGPDERQGRERSDCT